LMLSRFLFFFSFKFKFLFCVPFFFVPLRLDRHSTSQVQPDCPIVDPKTLFLCVVSDARQSCSSGNLRSPSSFAGLCYLSSSVFSPSIEWHQPATFLFIFDLLIRRSPSHFPINFCSFLTCWIMGPLNLVQFLVKCPPSPNHRGFVRHRLFHCPRN
jgi:hypothetical protein